MEKSDVLAAISRAWAIENLLVKASLSDIPDGDFRDAILQLSRDLRHGLENFLAESE